MKKQSLKYFFCTAMLCIAALASIAQNGKYAGSLKKLIGQHYTNEKKITGLKGYHHLQGDLISDLANPYQMTLDLFINSTAAVVLFSQISDTLSKIYTIVDVIEIKNIQRGWETKVADCQQGQTEGGILIAVVKTQPKAYLKMVKAAWRCNRDKLRFEAIKPTGIKCINEGFGE